MKQNNLALSKVIDNYHKKRDQNKSVLQETLLQKILDIITSKQPKTFIKYSYKYHFHYARNADPLPDRITDSSQKEKSFGTALCIFFDHLFESIHCALFAQYPKESQKKILSELKSENINIFVIRQFFTVIHNHVFQNNRYHKEKPMSEFSTDDQEMNFFDIPYEGPSSEDNLMEIAAQKEAFFWIPGTKYIDEIPVMKKSVYIAFFYMWLRMLSLASKTDIAKEVNVHSANVTRWLPQGTLQLPFKTIPKLFPVYMNKKSREQAGLFNQQIRCYTGTYQSDYLPVEKRKQILWDIYENLLLNHDWTHYLSTKTLHTKEKQSYKQDNYSFELTTADTLSPVQRKEFVIHITSLEVNDEITHSNKS
jgi:hypothetical protein